MANWFDDTYEDETLSPQAALPAATVSPDERFQNEFVSTLERLQGLQQAAPDYQGAPGVARGLQQFAGGQVEPWEAFQARQDRWKAEQPNLVKPAGLWQTVKDVAGAIPETIRGIPAVVASGIEGTENPYATRDWKDTLIEENRARNLKKIEEMKASGEYDRPMSSLPFTRGEFAETVQSFPYTAATMLPAIAGNIAGGIIGGAAGGAIGGPGGAVAGGRAVGGLLGGAISAYLPAGYAAANQFIRDGLNKFQSDFKTKERRDPTPEEIDRFYRETLLPETPRILHGESGPEAVGTATEIGLAKSAFGDLLKSGGSIPARIAKAGAKIALSAFVVEPGTELLTQQIQQPAYSRAGLTEEAPRDWSLENLAKSGGEVYKQAATTSIFFTLLGMGGGGAYRSFIKNPSDAEAVANLTANPEVLRALPKDTLENLQTVTERLNKAWVRRNPNLEKAIEAIANENSIRDNEPQEVTEMRDRILADAVMKLPDDNLAKQSILELSGNQKIGKLPKWARWLEIERPSIRGEMSPAGPTGELDVQRLSSVRPELRNAGLGLNALQDFISPPTNQTTSPEPTPPTTTPSTPPAPTPAPATKPTVAPADVKPDTVEVVEGQPTVTVTSGAKAEIERRRQQAAESIRRNIENPEALGKQMLAEALASQRAAKEAAQAPPVPPVVPPTAPTVETPPVQPIAPAPIAEAPAPIPTIQGEINAQETPARIGPAIQEPGKQIEPAGSPGPSGPSGVNRTQEVRSQEVQQPIGQGPEGELTNAQQITSPGPAYGGGGPRPEIRQESRSPAEGGEGVRGRRPEIGAAKESYAQQEGLSNPSGLSQSNSGLLESIPNRIPTNADLFPNRVDRETISVQGFDALDGNRQRVVLGHVAGMLHDDQVVRTVIKSVPIDVVDMLIGKKGATEDVLNNPAMLPNALSIPDNRPIPASARRFVEAMASGPAFPSASPTAIETGLPVEPTGTELPGKSVSATRANQSQSSQNVISYESKIIPESEKQSNIPIQGNQVAQPRNEEKAGEVAPAPTVSPTQPETANAQERQATSKAEALLTPGQPPASTGAAATPSKPGKKVTRLSTDEVEKYFSPGRIVPSYGGGRDKVVSFNRTKDGWYATVYAVDAEGNRLPVPDGRDRSHETMPSVRDYEQVVGEKATGKPLKVQPKSAVVPPTPAPTSPEAEFDPFAAATDEERQATQRREMLTDPAFMEAMIYYRDRIGWAVKGERIFADGKFIGSQSYVAYPDNPWWAESKELRQAKKLSDAKVRAALTKFNRGEAPENADETALLDFLIDHYQQRQSLADESAWLEDQLTAEETDLLNRLTTELENHPAFGSDRLSEFLETASKKYPSLTPAQFGRALILAYEDKLDALRKAQPAGRTERAAEGTPKPADEGAGAPVSETPLLTSYTLEELDAENARVQAELEKQRQAEVAAEAKRQADKDVGGFTLSGSNRPADIAAAAGQEDLLAGAKEAPKAEKAPAPAAQPEAQKPKEPEVAPAPVEAESFSQKETRARDLVAKKFLDGEKFSGIAAARKFVYQVMGLEDKPASKKIAEEVIEQAVVQTARGIVSNAQTPEVAFKRLVSLYQEQQPNLATRTSESVTDQAYSTPIPLAYLASQLAGIGLNPDAVVVEPTAGNGALLVSAKPKQVKANEKNRKRADYLKRQGFDVSQSDATTWRSKEPVDILIANPPFGTVTVDGKKQSWTVPSRIAPDGKYTTTEIDHAIALQQLSNLKDDGVAVLLVGGVDAPTEAAKKNKYAGKAKRDFYWTLVNDYNVVDMFTVGGDLYARQGAKYPADVIVIHGRRTADNAAATQLYALPAATLPRIYESWDQLSEVIRNETNNPAWNPALREPQAVAPGKNQPGTPSRDRPDTGGRGSRPAGDVAGSPQPVGDMDRGGEQGRDSARDRGEVILPGTAPADDAVAAPAGGERGGRVRPDDRGGVAPQPDAVARPSEYGQGNKVFTADAAAAARERLRKKLGQVRSGIDPEMVQDGIILAGYHIEAGARQFAAYAKAMLDDLGDGARNYLRSWYEAARHYPGFDNSGMTPADETDRIWNKMQEDWKAPKKPAAPVASVEAALPAEPAPKKPETPKEKPSEGQVNYAPASKIGEIGTLMPVNMQVAAQNALQNLESRVGPVDAYVASELGYEQKDLGQYFAAEQIDSLGLAIDNLKRGRGYITADQTGVGKGRVNAGIMRWALRNGKTPIFVTEKPNLYRDMIRDLRDIGMGQGVTESAQTESLIERILITNAGSSIPMDDAAMEWYAEAEKAKAEGNQRPKQYGKFLKTPTAEKQKADLVKAISDVRLPGNKEIIFTTYDQMNPLDGQRTIRHDFMDAFAGRSVLLLDESHNAGGSGKADPNKFARSKYFRDLVEKVDGTFYSSATFAKRPDVMDLYRRTDMSMAVDNIDRLGEIISAGGIPLQQVSSAMLVEAGQLLRRERSFDGVQYETPTAPINQQVAENIATAMRKILSFSQAMREVVKGIKDDLQAQAASMGAQAGADLGSAESTGFTSVMHNLIAQFLLGLKSRAAVDQAISALQNGEKPIITVANTLESLLKEYTTDAGINIGDPTDMSFGTLLERYLEKSRMVRERKPFQKSAEPARRLEDHELTPRALRAFDDALKEIRAHDWSEIPSSPIDFIKSELIRAGYTVGEITGREYVVDYLGSTPTLQARGENERGIPGRIRAIQQFNDGKIDALILNRAGATGLSLHASQKTGTDLRRRHMIIAQPEANIDTHMQMLGRVHRTGQVIAPRYSQLVGNIPAEIRPAAVLAKKMASLNANTTSARSSAVTSKDALDFMNVYGDEAVAAVMFANQDLHRQLGEPLRLNDAGDGFEAADAARKVTGYLPMLPLRAQEQVYRDIESEYRSILETALAMGENKLEALTLETDAREVSATQVFDGIPGETSPFAGPARAVVYDIKRQGRSMTQDEIRQELATFAGVADPMAGGALRKKVDVLREDLQKDLAKFLDAEAVHLSEAQMTSLETRAYAMADKVDTVLRTLSPGTSVSVVSGNGNVFYGVVIGVERAGKPKNPAVNSAWRIRIAVADSLRVLSLPLTRMEVGSPDLAQAGRVAIEPYDPMMVQNSFDNQEGLSREERTILEGNLLAAYSQFPHGQIVYFRRSEGDLRQGILMPRSFDLQKAMAAKAAVMKTSADAAAFMADRAKTKYLSGQNGDVVLRYLPRADRFEMTTPKSKAQGGRWFLNDRLIALSDDGFVSVGNSYRADFSPSRLPAVLDAVYAQLGERMKAVDLSQSQQDAAQPDASQRRFSRAPDTLTEVNLTQAQARAEAVEALGETNVRHLERNGFAVWLEPKPGARPLPGNNRVYLSSTGQEVVAPADAQAFVQNGVTHLIPSNMRTGALNALLHESAHLMKDERFAEGDRTILRMSHAVLNLAGLRNFIGNPGFQDLAEQVQRMAREGNSVALKALAQAQQVDPNRVAEESVAYLVEYGDMRLPIVRRILAAIRAALYRMGVKMELRPEDVRQLAISALKARAQRNKGEQRKLVRLAELEKEYEEKYGDIALGELRIEVLRNIQEDTTLEQFRDLVTWMLERRYSVAPAIEVGEATMEEFEAIRARFQARQAETPFRQWFGKGTPGVTATVDGTPIILYHGTNNPLFTEWDASRAAEASGHPTSGLGFFMTADKRAAARYGNNLLELHAKIEKPYYLTDADLTGIETRQDAERLRWNLMKQGYDGAVVEAPGAPHANYVIAFRPNQIKFTTTEKPTASPDMRYSRPPAPGQPPTPADAQRFLNDIGGMDLEPQPNIIKRIWRNPSLWRKELVQFFTDAAGNTRPAWTRLLSRQQIVEMLQESPIAALSKLFEDTARLLDAEKQAGKHVPFDIAKRWREAAAKSRDKGRNFAKLLFFTTLEHVDPTQPLPDRDTFKDDRAYLDAKQSHARATQMLDDLRRTNPVMADLYKEVMDENKRSFAAYHEALQNRLSRGANGIFNAMMDRAKDVTPTGTPKTLTQRLANLANADSAAYDAFVDVVRQRLANLKMEDADAQAIRDTLPDAEQKALLDDIVTDVQSKIKDSTDSLRFIYEQAKILEPYFPLSRWGDYQVYAEKAGEPKPIFSSFTRQQDQRAAIAQLQKEGWTVKVGYDIKEALTANPPADSFLGKMFVTVDEIVSTKKEAAALKDEFYQMYLRSLPELSSRKHFLHRKGIPGFSMDALRGFAQLANSRANAIARLNHSDTLSESLVEMERTLRRAGRDPNQAEAINRAGALLGELQGSYEWMMNPTNATWANRLTSFGFLWHLTNPSTALINLTQLPIATFPALAAQFKAPGRAFSALNKAIKDYGGWKFHGKVAKEEARQRLFAEYDGDLGRMMESPLISSQISRTEAVALAGMSDDAPEFAGGVQGASAELYRSALYYGGWLYQKAEVANREITVIAAYRMAREEAAAKGLTREQAHDYASKIAYNLMTRTQGDFSLANRPWFMRGNAMRVMFLFRSFAHLMTWNILRDTYQWKKGQTPESRQIARDRLLWTCVSSLVFAGATGFPAYTIIAAIANAFWGSDPDDPWDFDTAVRNELQAYGGETFMRTVMSGPVGQAPRVLNLMGLDVRGVDIAPRMSLDLARLWFRRQPDDLEGGAAMDWWMAQVAGPLYGTARGLAEGMRYLGQTSYDPQAWLRSIEGFTPAPIRNLAKSVRFKTEGVTSRQGDLLMDDFTYTDMLAQAIGFTPDELQDQYRTNTYAWELKKAIDKRRKNIYSLYIFATERGDTEMQKEAIGRVERWNQLNPEYPITYDNLRSSYQKFVRARAEQEGGVFIPSQGLRARVFRDLTSDDE